jgi:uncharacterized membrane protein required for colicin V production
VNWLLIVVLVILGGCAIYGRSRGFIKTVFALFSTIIALSLTMWVSPTVSKQVQKNEKVMTFVTQKVSKVIKSKKKNKKVAEQVNYINKLPLPKAMKKTMIENNNTESYKAMAVKSFQDYICGSIARVIINAGVFLIVMLALLIGMAILCEALNIISKLPLINGLNKTAGLFAGLLQGIVIVWIGCIVLTMFSGTKLGQEMFTIINQDPFLSIIYNNNLFLKFITNLGATLF